MAATAKKWQLTPIDQLNLQPDDIEIRFWYFGMGERGYVVRRRDDQWSSYYLDSIHRQGYRVRPVCDEGDLLMSLEALDLWRLESPPEPERKRFCPDEDQNNCVEEVILDGHTLALQTLRGGELRHAVFPHPEPNQGAARQMIAIRQLLHEQLGFGFERHFDSHPSRLSLGNIVLVKMDRWLSAYRINEISRSPNGLSTIQYEVAAVPLAVPDFSVEPIQKGENLWRTNHALIDHELEVSLDRYDALKVSLDTRAVQDPRERQLAVTSFKTFEEIDLTDPSIRFLPDDSASQCQRFRSLDISLPDEKY